MKQYSFNLIILLVLFSCNISEKETKNNSSESLIYEQEKHFKNKGFLALGSEKAKKAFLHLKIVL